MRTLKGKVWRGKPWKGKGYAWRNSVGRQGIELPEWPRLPRWAGYADEVNITIRRPARRRGSRK